jgi:hypothetical protein
MLRAASARWFSKAVVNCDGMLSGDRAFPLLATADVALSVGGYDVG